MATKRVFVSFDYENDRRYKHLLEAWHANPNFTFVFADQTPTEINSQNVGRVKSALTAKINGSTHTLVIVGRYANTRHKDATLIGYKNWINFEVARSKANGNKLVAVKLDRNFESPDELVNSGASWAMSFGETQILNALAKA